MIRFLRVYPEYSHNWKKAHNQDTPVHVNTQSPFHFNTQYNRHNTLYCICGLVFIGTEELDFMTIQHNTAFTM